MAPTPATTRPTGLPNLTAAHWPKNVTDWSPTPATTRPTSSRHASAAQRPSNITNLSPTPAKTRPTRPLDMTAVHWQTGVVLTDSPPTPVEPTSAGPTLAELTPAQPTPAELAANSGPTKTQDFSSTYYCADASPFSATRSECQPSRPSELSTAYHPSHVIPADSPSPSVVTTEPPEHRPTSPPDLSTAFYQASIVLADSSITEVDDQFRVECL